jgi:hypothetical protein
MAEKYLTRLEERAKIRDEALLQKVAVYRGSASQTHQKMVSESPSDNSNQGVKFTKLMAATVAAIWINSFLLPILSVLAIGLLLPIYKGTKQGDNWRYGADFISGLAILFSFATIIKAAI